MINPFRRRTREVADAKLTSLAPKPELTELSSTITHPETYSPIPLNVNQMNVHEHKGAYLQLITGKVEALHASGGLDQDNLNALFREIATWRDTFEAKLRQDAEAARHVAVLVLNQVNHNLEAERGKFHSLDRQHAEALEHHQAVLDRQGLSRGPARPPQPETLGPLSEGASSHLDGHLPSIRPLTRNTDTQKGNS